MKRQIWIGLVALLCATGGTAAPFTYQGRLSTAGQPASGAFDFQVGLFSALVGGNQLGNTVLLNGVEVHGGAFTVELDFGEGVFDGHGRWLDLAVRSAGGAQFTALKPRQALTAVPYAQYALTPAGPRGEKGDPGVPGTIGPQGLAGLRWRGAYDTFASYQPGDALEFEGQSWVAIQETQIGEAPHALGRNWSLLAARGDRGGQGERGETGPVGPSGPAGLRWRGAYDTFASYQPNDALEFEGQSWVAVRETQIGEAPHVLGLNWSLLAARGDRGVQGERGEAGPVGPQGPAGMKWRGAWDTFALYDVNDLVEYEGASWIAVEPPLRSFVPNEHNPSWNLLSARGFTGAKGEKGERGDPGPKGDPGGIPSSGPVGINVASPFGGVGLHVAAPSGSSDALLLGGNLGGTLMVFGQTAPNQGANYIGSIKTAGTWGELQLNPSGGSVSVGRVSGANLDVNGMVNALRFTGDGSGLSKVPGTLGETSAVFAWGDNAIGQTNVPLGLSQVLAIAGGGMHTVVLTKERKVMAWGWNGAGQCNVPSILSDVAAIAAGYNFTLALRREGTLAAWGASGDGQIGFPGGLSDVVAISAGHAHGVALRAVGTVVVWGDNTFKQREVPNGFGNVVKIAAGLYHTLALTADGTVVAWGDNDYGQSNVPSGLGPVREIAAGGNHSLALLANGTVVAWGQNDDGGATVPAGLTGVTAISAGVNHFLALKADGTLVAWGSNSHGEGVVPDGMRGVTSIAAGYSHVIVTKKTPSISGDLLVEGRVMALSVNTTSDRNAKEDFMPIDAGEVLERVAALPISRWSFKGNSGERHLGPMAQDFYAAFGLGTDERHITTVDADGVALAAIQGLHQQLEKQKRENAVLRRDLNALMAEVLRLSGESRIKPDPIDP